MLSILLVFALLDHCFAHNWTNYTLGSDCWVHQGRGPCKPLCEYTWTISNSTKYNIDVNCPTTKINPAYCSWTKRVVPEGIEITATTRATCGYPQFACSCPAGATWSVDVLDGKIIKEPLCKTKWVQDCRIQILKK